MESYAAGETTPPLLDETIGANFERTVAAHADREALVEVATGRRWTYAELDRDVDALARGLLARRHRQGRPGRHLGAQLRGVDAHAVRHGEDRRDPGQRQPGVPHPRARLRAQPVRHAAAGLRRPSFKTSDYRAMVEEVRADCPALERVVYLGTDDWASAGRRRRRRPTSLAERTALAGPDDPINIQYTSGTTGHPKGATLSHRNILNNGFFVTELIGFTEEDRLCIPVPFYHCFGMVMGNLGCTTHGADDGDPGARLRPGGHAARDRRGALHGACTASRRCSSPCRTTPTSPTTT